MVLTAGKISGSALTAGKLEDILAPHIHEKTRQHLKKGGFLKLSNLLNFANKAYGVIDKTIPIVTKGVSAYNSFKKASEGMKKKDDDIDIANMQLLQGKGMPRKKRYGEGGTGIRKMKQEPKQEEKQEMKQDEGAGLKKKRKLPPALLERAKAIGKMMKQGMNMKEASEKYKSMK
jgi:hypothetical protein